MRLVGLTGGIASGKSTVSNLFKASDTPVVDADLVARDVLKKETGGWKLQRLERRFYCPVEKLIAQNSARVAGTVYIFWYLLRNRETMGQGCQSGRLDIPLLFEAKLDKWTKPVIVVWVNPKTQLKRLTERDGSNEADARNSLDAQMPLELKRSKADIVIDNNGSLEDLNEQLKKVLFEIKRPLTWTESWRSRQGVLVSVLSAIAGAFVCERFYNGLLDLEIPRVALTPHMGIQFKQSLYLERN